MKILALSNLYPPDVMGGYEIAMSQAVDGLRRRGNVVEVLTTAPRQSVAPTAHVHRRMRLVEDRNWLPPGLLGDDRAILTRDVESRLINAHNVFVLIEAVDEWRPDVVFLGNVVGLGGLALVAGLQHLGIPWVWHLGDCVPCDLAYLLHESVPALARAFSREVSGLFLLVSGLLGEEIREGGITLNGRIETAPYWVNGPVPAARPCPRRAGPLRVMSAGLVNREKGVDVLIKAAAWLRDRGRDEVAIDVYGRVADPSLATLIRSLGVDDRVRLLGPKPHEELMDRYAEYDLFAFPTREREPFGIVPLEAASRGCVPVVSRRCGIAEWLVHGVHCLKSERSAAAFGAVFLSVMNGEVDLAPLALRARAAVRDDFHLDAVLPRIERLLLEASRAPRRAATPSGEIYRLARLAEGLAQSICRDVRCA